MKNTGVRIRKPKDTDYFSGKETGIVYVEVNPSGDWSPYLPSEERQAFKYFDSMACVTFSALNVVETQINFLIKNKKISDENIKKLMDWGFIDDQGNLNCSDRFTAKMSGTTHQGNYLTNVGDSIRKDGLVPEKMWSYPLNQDNPVFNWDKYYEEIPQEIKDFAKNILAIFDFKYEWVYVNQCSQPPLDIIKTQLKQAPLQIASPTCIGWNTGTQIKPCGTCTANHATIIYKVEDTSIDDYDHYDPFKKTLTMDYTIPYCLKLMVSTKESQPLPPATFSHVFTIDMIYGSTNNEIAWLQKGLKILELFPLNVIETGNYFNITQKAVKDFQYKYKVANWLELLIVDGKRVGQKTRAKLNELLIK